MSPLPLSVAAAASFGTGDFFQGLASRRAPLLPVLVVGQGAGGLAVLLAALVQQDRPGLGALAWGGVAGLGATVGSVALLRGFRHGRLAVVAPTASVVATGLPLGVDALRGVALDASTLLGIGLALLAVVLVSRTKADERAAPAGAAAGGAGWGLAAGAGHAGMYLGLDQAGSDSGAWPVVSTYAVLVVLAAGTAAARRRRLLVDREALPVVLAGGLLGAAGTALFLFAAAGGTVGIAAVVVELSPLVTALLARALLHETLPPTRQAGLVAAAVALVLLTA